MSTENPDRAHLLEEITAGRWVVEDGAPKELPPKRVRIPRHFVIIGTGGSYDYLTNSTSDQRFWPINGTTPSPAPNEHPTRPTCHDADLVKRLLTLTPDVRVRVLKKPDDEDDGVRDTEDL